MYVEPVAGPIQQGWDIPLVPQQIGLTGEDLGQRYAYAWVIQPQYPSAIGYGYYGYYQPPSQTGRAQTIAYGAYVDAQRLSPGATPGSGPATLTPAIYAQLAQQLNATPAATRAVWALSEQG